MFFVLQTSFIFFVGSLLRSQILQPTVRQDQLFLYVTLAVYVEVVCHCVRGIGNSQSLGLLELMMQETQRVKSRQEEGKKPVGEVKHFYTN